MFRNNNVGVSMTIHTSVRPHLSGDEIKAKIKETVGFWRVKRWLVIWNAFADPRPAKEIALHLGMSVHTVHNLISSYNRHGSRGIETAGKGGNKRTHLSFEDESEFLKSLESMASSGQIGTISEIQAAYEKRVGYVVHKSSVYRLLKRHGWRKVMPRPFHVNSKKEEQDDFKKNFRKK